jgi:hypothetical protein
MILVIGFLGLAHAVYVRQTGRKPPQPPGPQVAAPHTVTKHPAMPAARSRNSEVSIPIPQRRPLLWARRSLPPVVLLSDRAESRATLMARPAPSEKIPESSSVNCPGSPRAATPVAAPAPRTPQIVGAWKDDTHVLRLWADGEIAVIPAAAHNTQRLATIRTASTGATALTGHYELRREVLCVCWDHGGRTNYGWSVEGDDLLMTDHDGHHVLMHRYSEP